MMKKFPLEHLFNMILHEKYSFSDFLSFELNDEVSVLEVKSRIVYSPSKKLKKYHNFINMVIGEQLNFNTEVVFSYRKGANAFDAVKSHRKNKYFFQTDISSFYSSIDSDLIRNVLIENIDRIPVSDIEVYLNRIVDMLSYGGVLSTGFSTSPLISNSALLGFDNLLHEYCKNNQMEYTRYSDDIIISSKEKINSDIEILIESYLNKLYNNSFSINKSKSRYSKPGQKVKVLGMVVLPNGDVTVDTAIKRRVEFILHFYREDRERLERIFDGEMDKGLDSLSGTLNYIKVVDEGYLSKLMSKYGVTVIDTLLHRSLSK